jgi:type I restriction enzyme R subunit
MSSKVFFKQHIGRGCRIDPITNKYFFRIIDYVNATRLLDDWDYPAGAKLERVVEGPFDLSLEGLLIHHDTQSPISDARIVAQIAPNMQRIARSDTDGRFVLNQLPHSPITIYITKKGFRTRQLTITPTEEAQTLVIELKPQKPVAKKIKLIGIEVHIAEETKIILTADGKTLTDAEYKEYSKEGIVKRTATLQELRSLWIDTEKRKDFLEALKNKSIYPELLASIVKRPDADTFDIIAHIAFDAPILTKDERANAFINKKQFFLAALGSDPRKVILTLLDKYRIGGVEQIRPEVFRVPPFDRMGYLRGVADMFGGFDRLKEALAVLQSGLYEEVVSR